MKYITKLKLAVVQQICDAEDKSTEYMLQLMQDVVKVELDTCINYMQLGEKEHARLYNEVNVFTKVLIDLDEILLK